jgi:hypothetical protein
MMPMRATREMATGTPMRTPRLVALGESAAVVGSRPGKSVFVALGDVNVWLVVADECEVLENVFEPIDGFGD